jgi:hypothetical protein
VLQSAQPHQPAQLRIVEGLRLVEHFAADGCKANASGAARAPAHAIGLIALLFTSVILHRRDEELTPRATVSAR